MCVWGGRWRISPRHACLLVNRHCESKALELPTYDLQSGLYAKFFVVESCLFIYLIFLLLYFIKSEDKESAFQTIFLIHCIEKVLIHC